MIKTSKIVFMYKKILYVLFISVVFGFSMYLSSKTAMAATPHPAGTLVQNGSTIWWISEDGDERLPFDSAEKFFSHRLSFDRVVPANAADMALPEGDSPAWGDGVLFADKAVIYQVSDGKKYGFTSAEVFLGQGFKFEMVKNGNLSKLVEGKAISQAGAKHLNGTLLNSNGMIWTWEDSEAKAFPSEAVFFSHGGNYTQVVAANSNDKYSELDIMSYRTGTLINDSGAVWVIDEGKKLGFPSVGCFLGFGFNFSFVLNGSTAGISKGSNICADTIGTQAGNIHSYTKQFVIGNPGEFEVRMETFDLSSGKVRVITDTAYDQDCNASCPVTSLKAYAEANGAQHGMNGTYFCPKDYSECQSISNSFFWKIIDTKAGVMVNERSGLGENDPFLTFDSVGQPKYFSHWNDYEDSNFKASAGINSPSLIEDGRVNVDNSKLDDKQKTVRSTRGAIAVKDNTLYLIHVYGATVPDSANVLKTLGVDYALLMDGGGSSALLYENEYKVGPGRNIPNAILVQIVP